MSTIKITVKTLKNKKYELQINESDTILSIKNKIDSELNLGEPETQKLIHHGKILKDDQTAKSSGFKDNDFLVCMVRKQKKKKTPKNNNNNTQQTSSSTSTTNTTTTTSNTNNTNDNNNNTNTASNDATQNANKQENNNDNSNNNSGGSSGGSGNSSLLTGQALESAIQDCVDMGFEREKVIQCFRAAFNNKERAIQYLMDGIPPNLMRQPVQQPPAQPPQQNPANPANVGGGNAGNGGNGGGAAAPQLNANQFQQAIQGNQQMLAGMVAQLAQQNPQVCSRLVY